MFTFRIMVDFFLFSSQSKVKTKKETEESFARLGEWMLSPFRLCFGTFTSFQQCARESVYPTDVVFDSEAVAHHKPRGLLWASSWFTDDSLIHLGSFLMFLTSGEMKI